MIAMSSWEDKEKCTLYSQSLCWWWPNGISNHILGEVWGEITYPFPNFNGVTV